MSFSDARIRSDTRPHLLDMIHAVDGLSDAISEIHSKAEETWNDRERCSSFHLRENLAKLKSMDIKEAFEAYDQLLALVAKVKPHDPEVYHLPAKSLIASAKDLVGRRGEVKGQVDLFQKRIEELEGYIRQREVAW